MQSIRKVVLDVLFGDPVEIVVRFETNVFYLLPSGMHCPHRILRFPWDVGLTRADASALHFRVL